MLTLACMTLVQKLLIAIPSLYKRAKIGLRSRFYLNCSHMVQPLQESSLDFLSGIDPGLSGDGGNSGLTSG